MLRRYGVVIRHCKLIEPGTVRGRSPKDNLYKAQRSTAAVDADDPAIMSEGIVSKPDLAANLGHGARCSHGSISDKAGCAALATSTKAICPSSAKICLGSSPSPASRQQWPKVFQST
jgi:hypothetical protein